MQQFLYKRLILLTQAAMKRKYYMGLYSNCFCRSCCSLLQLKCAQFSKQGLGFRAWGLVFRVLPPHRWIFRGWESLPSSGLRVWGLGFVGFVGLGFRV